MLEITTMELAFAIITIAGFTGFIAFHVGYIFGSIKEKEKVMHYSMNNTMHMVEEMIKDLYPLEIKNK